MYELDQNKTMLIVAGSIYVDQQWKDNNLIITSTIMTLGFSVCGALAACVWSPNILIWIMGGVLGGGLGYSSGYGIATLDNLILKNDTWYCRNRSAFYEC